MGSKDMSCFIISIIVVSSSILSFCIFFFFQAEDGIRDLVRSRGLGDVYKRQRLYAVRHDGEWLHVSTPQDIKEVENYLKTKHRNLSLIHI